jgi:acyl-coenzyme A synthetase/AMP-(fatty) acid ligase
LKIPSASFQKELKLKNKVAEGKMKPKNLDETFQKMDSKGFYRLEVPEKLNTARLVVDYWAQHGRGKDVAIYYKDQKITYQDLKDLTDRFANATHRLGLVKGDTYLIRTPNQPEYMVSFLGGQKIGAVPIPTSTMLREYELQHIINNSEAKAVITTCNYIEAIENIRPKCKTLKHVIVIGEPSGDQISYEDFVKADAESLPYVETLKDDPSFFLYTSGTTGAPKGVVHGHRFIIGAGDPIGRFTMGLEKGDICGGPTALTWMYALGHNFLFAFRWGVATAIYADERFNPERAYEFIEKFKITIFAGTPTIYRIMLAVTDAEKKYTTRSLKYCLSSGEPLLAETWRQWMKRFGVKIIDSMGQTEAHEFCTTQTHLPVKIGSMGKPLPGIEVAIVNDKGERLPPGEMGHLAIRRDHPGLFTEYFKMPEQMQEVSKPNNWYDTKDLAYMDEDGYFWYGARSDDIMTCHGYRISPAEVETALQEHPAVLESGVAGVMDPETGETVKAWVVLHDAFNPTPELAKELQNHVKATIAPYKYPREIEFLKELPKTSSGKILRRELRRWHKEKQDKE